MGTWRASFVALRILSVYLIVHALIVAASFSPFLVSGNGNARWAIIVAIIVLGAAGGELWLAADGIADRIADRVEDLEAATEPDEESRTPPPIAIDATTALWIGLTILGIALSVDAIAGAMVQVGQLIQIRGFGAAPRSPQYLALAANALRLAIGLGLVFGAQSVAAALRKLRTRPIEPTETNEPKP